MLCYLYTYMIENKTLYRVEAITSGCKDKGRSISYEFIESSHNHCLKKGELMLDQNSTRMDIDTNYQAI